MTDYENRKVLVVGLGVSGRAAARLLKSVGAQVFCTDAGSGARVEKVRDELTALGIEVELGGHRQQFFRDCGLVVVSPGVPDSASPVIWADRNGVPVISEMELGYRFCKTPIVAVTGTNGKSTVTAMINRVLNQGGVKSIAAGNYGVPLAARLAEAESCDAVVAETSSFQLERIESFRPHVSVLLNIAPDHLDRYVSMEGYVTAKMRIFENQTERDYVIINENLRKSVEPFRANCPARFIFFGKKKISDLLYAGDKVISHISGRKVYDLSGHYKLEGYHNIENLLAAVAVSELFGIDQAALCRALDEFEGLEHRIEFVEQIDGIRFVNDSKATNVDSAIKAIKSVVGPVLLIAGGKDKKMSFRPLAEAAKARVKAAILIGEAALRMEKEFDGITEVRRVDSLDLAVDLAYNLAEHGDTVLLSPACSSFDQFSGFEERGDIYKNKVRRLKAAIEKVRC